MKPKRDVKSWTAAKRKHRRREKGFDFARIKYEPDTGFFFVFETIRADCWHGKYRCVSSHGIKVQAHRLAWRLHYGEWPPAGLVVDHINRNPQDNRIANLRLATRSQNGANRSLGKSNSSGQFGVTWCNKSKRWYVACAKQRLSASHKISAIIAARLVRRLLYGEFAA